MERVIKFRGKSIVTGDWLYGYVQKFYGKKQKITCVCAGSVVDESEVQVYKVYPDTVGQFTGLLDKDGKEIYEWDIVHLKRFDNDGIYLDFSEEELLTFDIDELKGRLFEELTGEIEYCDCAFCLKDFLLSGFCGDQRLSVPIHEVEIIGNKWDNPELLEGGNNDKNT